MPKKINYVLKVTDAKLLDIKKALESKNIKLDSIIEVYKEEITDSAAPAKPADPSKGTASSSPSSKPPGAPPS
jgi:hypothetical protein